MKEFPDYLLIKDLPGHKRGCRFTIGKNWIYYIISGHDNLIEFEKKTYSDQKETL